MDIKAIENLLNEIKGNSKYIIERINDQADQVRSHGGTLNQLTEQVQLQQDVIETILAKLN